MKGALIGLLIVAALGAAGCGDGDDEDTETREFISVANPKTEFFTGQSYGDRIGFQEQLQEDGENVGSIYNVCTVYPAEGDPRVNCTATVDIDDEGSVTIQGVVSFAGGDSEIAITGGTGDFSGASGTATVRVTEAAKAPLTLEIVK